MQGNLYLILNFPAHSFPDFVLMFLSFDAFLRFTLNISEYPVRFTLAI